MSALALEPSEILTGVRLGEAVEATWAEIDFERKVWTIPAARMKRSVEYVVPLSGRAIAILTALHRHAAPGSKIIFQGGLDGRGGPITPQTVWDQAQRVSGGKASVHGWGATLRSWMADHSRSPSRSLKLSLRTRRAELSRPISAPGWSNSTRPVMECWAQYLSGEEPGTAEIIPLSARRAHRA